MLSGRTLGTACRYSSPFSIPMILAGTLSKGTPLPRLILTIFLAAAGKTNSLGLKWARNRKSMNPGGIVLPGCATIWLQIIPYYIVWWSILDWAVLLYCDTLQTRIPGKARVLYYTYTMCTTFYTIVHLTILYRTILLCTVLYDTGRYRITLDNTIV